MMKYAGFRAVLFGLPPHPLTGHQTNLTAACEWTHLLTHQNSHFCVFVWLLLSVFHRLVLRPSLQGDTGQDRSG